MKKVLISSILFILISCGGSWPDTCQKSIMKNSDLICLSEVSEGYRVQVKNPWRNDVMLQSYLLSTKDKTDYTYSAQNNTIHIPLRKVVVMTNIHARLLSELGLVDNIAGICEQQYISDSTIISRCMAGTIIDCGNGMYPNIEKIMELKPDAILVSPFEETGYGQLEKLGIPIIECADYMEKSPLGRAEWIRLFGRLFGVEEVADSLYNKIEREYLEMKDMTSRIKEKRPSVMLDTKGGSAWYVAGGNSTIGQMIQDAGGEYVFSQNEKSGSIPLSFESVFDKAHDADIWLMKNSSSTMLTYNLLAADYKLYSDFKPFKTRQIWVCDVNDVPYFEVTSFHPEILLRDFISIFHPGLSDSYETSFYHRLDSVQN